MESDVKRTSEPAARDQAQFLWQQERKVLTPESAYLGRRAEIKRGGEAVGKDRQEH